MLTNNQRIFRLCLIRKKKSSPIKLCLKASQKCDRIKTKRQASGKKSGPLRTGKQPWEEKKTGIKN